MKTGSSTLNNASILDSRKNIGAVLLENGYITKGQLNEALEIQKITEQFFGDICVEKGWVTRYNLNKILKNTGKQIKIGEFLVEQQFITQEAIQHALDIQKYEKEHGFTTNKIGNILIREKMLDEYILIEALSKYLGIQFLDITQDNFNILDIDIRETFPHILQNYWQDNNIIPVFYLEGEEGKEGQLSIVTADPLNKELLHEVSLKTKCKISAYIGNTKSIQDGINYLYSMKYKEKKNKIKANNDGLQYNKFLDKILYMGLLKDVSDIHIEPNNNGEIIIRARKHGDLFILTKIGIENLNGLINVIKIKSEIDTSKKFLPQDGSFGLAIGGHILDIRVSTLPTNNGEKVVLRLLRQDLSTLTIKDSNLPPRIEKQLLNAIHSENGIILITGPTGSGKTTILHRLLKEISTEKINISTVEDPIEYKVGNFVNQSSINIKKEFTYDIASKSLLRQDPDVILIGEIRDRETALTATDASLTGHLVLSTLHTNDSLSSLIRLSKLGVDNWLLSSTLITVLNQRLIKGLCNQCSTNKKELSAKDIELLKKLYIDDSNISYLKENIDLFNIKEPCGCESCDFTGYNKQQVIVEQLVLSTDIKQMILDGRAYNLIMEHMRNSHKMNMLFEEGIRQVLLGNLPIHLLSKLPRGNYKLKSIEDIIKDATETKEVGMIDALNIEEQIIEPQNLSTGLNKSDISNEKYKLILNSLKEINELESQLEGDTLELLKSIKSNLIKIL